MAIKTHPDGLVVGPSVVPIVRAGCANVILVPLIAGLILLKKALTEIGATPWISAPVLSGFLLAALEVSR